MTPRSPSSTGLGLGHGRGGLGHHVEGADHVEPLDELERLEVVGGAVPVDHPSHPAGAGAVDGDAQRPRPGRQVHRPLAVVGLGDVAAQVGAPDLGGDRLGPLLVAVEDRDLDALGPQGPRGGRPEARGPAGDDGRDPVQLHAPIVRASPRTGQKGSGPRGADPVAAAAVGQLVDQVVPPVARVALHPARTRRAPPPSRASASRGSHRSRLATGLPACSSTPAGASPPTTGPGSS